MKTKRVGGLVLSLLLFTTPAFAVDRVSAVSLTKKVPASVSNCQNSKKLRLPLITWGGDIPTVHANGGKVETAPGSIFAKSGLKFTLKREDDFAEQVKSYLSCKSPFLRGTAGMINLASEVLNKDPRTRPQVVYQMTWSAGGDAMVVKSGINSPKDLKGKTVALQAYGPHTDYLSKVLADAGLSMKDVNLFWTKDLTGTEQTPVEALRRNDVDAAMVIIPDALALSSGGAVGSGAEDSVKGAKILLSTKSANRVIADVYAVRSDFLQANEGLVQKMVRGLLQSTDAVQSLQTSQSKDYRSMIRASAQILLDSPDAVEDTEGMYADAEFVGWDGNRSFFSNPSYPRNFERLNAEIQRGLQAAGLLAGAQKIQKPGWDYAALKKGLTLSARSGKPRFDKEAVAKVVSKRQKQGTLEKSGLFDFEVFFQPNQSTFSESLYQEAFDKAIDLASTYGGAILTVEGHSDPLGFLRKRKDGETDIVLRRIRQAAKNLSLNRGNAVRDSLVAYAKSKGVTLDPSQFAVVGHGIDKPATGMCKGVPCAPKTEDDWRSNMRVEFRIVQVEAETSVFKPL